MTQRIGVLGGSGLYDLPGLSDVREIRLETPFGDPSDLITVGRLGDAELAFLPRHGRGHRLTPSEVPYLANVWALKQLGCDWLVSVSAVGSLREHMAPGDAVLVDQFIDRTRSRRSTFFGEGVVAHVAFGDPVCGTLRAYLGEACAEAGLRHHDGGTYVCMEGPAFSTRAESELYRSWGAHVVGMTNLPEAKLAREASMSYATLALVTDYDCWHTGHDDVTVEQVIAVLHANVEASRRVLASVARRIALHPGRAPHHRALENALLTDRARIPPEARARLAPLLDPFLR